MCACTSGCSQLLVDPSSTSCWPAQCPAHPAALLPHPPHNWFRWWPGDTEELLILGLGSQHTTHHSAIRGYIINTWKDPTMAFPERMLLQQLYFLLKGSLNLLNLCLNKLSCHVLWPPASSRHRMATCVPHCTGLHGWVGWCWLCINGRLRAHYHGPDQDKN